MRKEKQRFFDQRNSYKKLIRDDARWDELKDIISYSINNIKPYKNENLYNIQYSDNDLLIGLNDLHYGVMIDNFWNKYSPEIAKERLEKYLNEIISIQKLHNSENCYVCANGDPHKWTYTPNNPVSKQRKCGSTSNGCI